MPINKGMYVGLTNSPENGSTVLFCEPWYSIVCSFVVKAIACVIASSPETKLSLFAFRINQIQYY